MICIFCKGKLIRFFGNLKFNDKFIGEYEVKNVEYYQCNKCNERFYYSDTLKIIYEKRQQKLELLLKQFPIGEFISSKEVADIFNIDLKKLSKDRKIRNKILELKSQLNNEKIKNKALNENLEILKDNAQKTFTEDFVLKILSIKEKPELIVNLLSKEKNNE